MKVVFYHFVLALSILLVGLTLGIIIWYGLWFTSDGHYDHFSGLENYYVNFSQAVQKGQVALLQQPDPRLSKLKDTHDVVKTHLPYLWDVSYFHGKYYIYWGPSPVLYFLI